ncbi:hypothetical protein SPIROBIBN47_250022 [uncultured spirochete]|uniref:Transposase n=1 Tax=uncultured spirochete TaxID=156406 RepID=A0A3P3XHZ5_9SPIR|nr:hypothetical protein SPIROBIBN47_250022 [uncultured spirochete]
MKACGIVESVVLAISSCHKLLIQYLKDFWTYETSPYVREKHLNGQCIGRRYVLESLHRGSSRTPKYESVCRCVHGPLL